VQDDVVAAAVAHHVEHLAPDELLARQRRAVGELDARVGPQRRGEVPFRVLGALLAQEEDVVLWRTARKGGSIRARPVLAKMGRAFAAYP